MLRPADNWFLSHAEPERSCLQQLRQIILAYRPDMTEKLSYGMPTYYKGKKRLVYLWYHKTHHCPYIGFIDGNLLNDLDLLAENRSRMKIFLINPLLDLPVKRIHELLGAVIKLAE
ncbi:MAG: DUF1801 domain-containing protein [Bacteroidota bacterium]|jgi:hypothetical protein